MIFQIRITNLEFHKNNTIDIIWSSIIGYGVIAQIVDKIQTIWWADFPIPEEEVKEKLNIKYVIICLREYNPYEHIRWVNHDMFTE